MRRLLPALALLLLLAGCDASDPGFEPAPPGATLEIVAPFTDLDLHVGEAREVDLAKHFRHSAGAPLTFEVRRDSGASVAVVPVEAGRFRLEGRSEGRSVIAVSARASARLRADTTFAVDVGPGLCPPEPGSDTADYFPMEAGQTWLFDYRHRSGPTSWGEPTIIEGELSLAFESVTCVNRVRTARVHEVLTVDGEVVRQRTRTFTEDSTNALRLELPAPTAEQSDVYPVPRYAPASSSDTLEHRLQQGTVLLLQRGHGVADWFASYTDSIWSESLRLTRAN